MTGIVAENHVNIDEAEEEAEMRKLLAKWEFENPEASDDDEDTVEDECLGYDDETEKYRREVHPKDNALDHVVLGTSDLDQSIDDFEKMTGVRPIMVVSHNGLGTKSARVAFEECCFIEIIGPDPKQSRTEQSEKLANIEPGKLVPLHYAIRNDNIKEMKYDTLPAIGFECDQVTMVAVDRGMPWTWDMVFLEGHDHGGLVPFFIKWNGINACGKLPVAGKVGKLVIRAPSDHVVHKVLADVEDIDTQTGDGLVEFSFTSSKGNHTFSASEPIGISFPKQGGLPVKEPF